jgi:hypothetical protein
VIGLVPGRTVMRWVASSHHEVLYPHHSPGSFPLQSDEFLPQTQHVKLRIGLQSIRVYLTQFIY